uniref:Uncharacterized protein n=1 Tax=viral metagenome TaxID=1070528 RepID=A0A6C0FAQ5_9ZZZZ
MPKKITYPATIVNSIIYSLINGVARVDGVVHDNHNVNNVKQIKIAEVVDFPNYPSIPVTSIAASAFASCPPPLFISIPSSVKNIGSNAFAVLYTKDENRKHVVYPIELKIPAEFASSTYFNMSIVSKITIISGNKIKDLAFKDAIILETVIFENDSSSPITSIGVAAFKDCILLKNIILPDTVIKIGENAFSGCTALPSITIPAGLDYIMLGTFYKCRNLTNVVIPSNVTRIETNAFFYCTNLKEVTFKQTEHFPTIGRTAFFHTADDKTAIIYKSVQNAITQDLLHRVGFPKIKEI